MEDTIDRSSIEILAVALSFICGMGFAALEAGLIAMGQYRLQVVADSEATHAGLATRALVYHHRIRATLLTGRTLCLALAVALGAHLGSQILPGGSGLLSALGLAFLYAMAIEFSTTIAERRTGRWTFRLLRWVRPLEWLLYPLATPLAWLAKRLEKSVSEANAGDSERAAELGLEQMIEEGVEEGAIAKDQAELLHRALDFRDTFAREIMVPRTQMVAVDADTPARELLGLIIDRGHSRYPVYRETPDRVEGVLYAKDLLSRMNNMEALDNIRVKDLMRNQVFFVPESQHVGPLLKEMQTRRIHMAVVVDEFGGTSGLCTLEDILEELVGEIRDEYDKEEPSVVALGAGRYLVDAGLSVYDLENELGIEIQEHEGDYDSLGGLMVELAGHVPQIGQSVHTPGFVLTVREGDERRVQRVELRPGQTPKPNP